MLCSKVESAPVGMSVAFIYDSAKDVLKWNNLSIKYHIHDVMRVGRLTHLSDEDFGKVKMSSIVPVKKMLNGDDIDFMARQQLEIKDGTD